MVGYTLNHGGYSLNHGGLYTPSHGGIYTQLWWEIHSTMVGYTPSHGGIYTQPWWDIHLKINPTSIYRVMEGFILEVKKEEVSTGRTMFSFPHVDPDLGY